MGLLVKTSSALAILALSASVVPVAFAAEGAGDEASKSTEALSLTDIFALDVVSASKTKEKLADAPSTIYVITEDDIRTNGYQTLEQALDNVPGVVPIHTGFFSFGGQRGNLSNFSQTLLMVNGREMQNIIAAETFISFQWTTHNIKRIEIVQGPGSALYGANAYMGVINIITKNDDKNYEGTEVQTELGTRSNKSVSVIWGKKAGDWRFSGSLRAFTTDGRDLSDKLNQYDRYVPAPYAGPLVTGSQRYVEDATAFPISLKLEWRDFYVGHESYFQNTRKGLEHVSADFENQHDHRQMEMNYAGWLSKMWGTEFNVEYQHTGEKFWAQHFPLSGGSFYYGQENSTGSKRDRVFAQANHTFFENDGSLLENLNLIGGLVYDRLDPLAVASSSTDPSPPFDETVSPTNPLHYPFYITEKWSIYAQVKKPLIKKFELTLGGRLDHHSNYGNVWTGRGGMVYHVLEKTNLKLMIGQAFREPNIFEVSGLAGSGVINQGLRPAQVTTIEFGANHQINNLLSAEGTLYHYWEKDTLINTGLTGFQNGDGTRGVSGAEALIRAQTDLGIGGDLGYAYVQTPNDTYAGESVSDLGVYRHRFNLGVNYEFIKNWKINARVNWYSSVKSKNSTGTEVFATAPAEQIVDIAPATVVNLTLSSSEFHVLGSQKWTMFFTVNNLLDADWNQPDVRTVGSKQFPQGGRSALLRLATNF